MTRSTAKNEPKFESESAIGGFALIDAIQNVGTGVARLGQSIGRSCLMYLSNEQVSEEWTAFALAEAEEELRRQPRRRS
jgi:hypothetical protein